LVSLGIALHYIFLVFCTVIVADIVASNTSSVFQKNALLHLTLILLTWRFLWAPNNVSKSHIGFNSAFKVLIHIFIFISTLLHFSVCYTRYRQTEPRITCIGTVYIWYSYNC